MSCEKCHDSGRLSVIGNDGRAHEIECRCGAALQSIDPQLREMLDELFNAASALRSE
ncbi:MAG TPA: hypothetical protein VGR84_19070 [Candidatus Acidoferrales bacterium]|nr:hypothetical protein [Candidatus Acidoferrales bacterium]